MGLVDKMAKNRNIRVNLFIKIIVIAMFLYHLWAAVTGVPEPLVIRPIHVAFVLFLGFLKFRASSKMRSDRIPWYDWLCASIGSASSLYILTDYNRISFRMMFLDPVMSWDWICGIIAIVLVLELARRTVGKTLAILVVVIIIYTLYGKYFPGILNHPGINPSNLLEHLYLSTNGLFGSLASLSLAEIFMFIMFGAFLQVAGGDVLFSDLAVAATKNTIGGPAKAAVLGSALFGCISGSGTANVFATGAVTIPLMKKAGYKPEFAAAVEAVASSLGQLIPPVMGAGAFLIAEFSQKPYMEVAAAAVVPSILYVYAIFMSVHFEAKRLNIGKYRDADQVDSVTATLYKYGHILVSVAILITLLMMRKTAYYAATFGMLSIIVISWLRSGTRIGPGKFIVAVEMGIDRIVSIAATLLAAGIAVSALQTTGTVFKITGVIVELAGGNLFIAALLVALTTIILGMGLPPTGAFLIASVFGAAALIEFGVAPFVTYMFIFMYGLTAMITPPVCTNSYAAATIAGTSFMKTGFYGFILGIPAYIIPIMVIYNPTLLLLFNNGVFFGIQSFLTALLGITCLVSGIFGILLKKSNILQRIILIVISFALIWPGTVSDIIGLLGFIGILSWQYVNLRLSKKMKIFGNF